MDNSQLDTDIRWMQYALELADRAERLGEVPVGAVLVADDQVLGEGWNSPISSHDPTAHAEMMALRAAAERVANYRLPHSTLYVTIEPCTMCAGAIVHARVSRLVYAAPEPKAGVGASNGCIFEQPYFNHRVEVVGGVCEAEAAAKIQGFFQRRRLEKKGG